ncbi:MAG TPA: TIGR01777 family oxidoreductase [Acidimicrobiia bacterium]|nr:TIGR01777 family oxidoreductase [Acidimicrobiia bacterium]
MDVAVTGSHGLIGTALCAALAEAGHRPIRIVRGGESSADTIAWDPRAGTIDAARLQGVDAVVNLAGAGIGDRRWTEGRKRLILESRVRGTRLLADTISTLPTRPSVFVSASAVGYYGNRGDEELTEVSMPGDDFVAHVCTEWEAATALATVSGIRVVMVRSGLVLARHGGVLKRLLIPFRLGLGGRTGPGTQYMSWITLDDEIAAIMHALSTPELAGAANLTAPNPATNAEFTATLGRVLGRPTVLPTPLLPLRAIYGDELVKTLLLDGQRALPARLDATGFRFAFPQLEPALRHVLGR